jgi:hypothetical protein
MMSLFTGQERRRSVRMPSKRPVLLIPADGEPRPVAAFTFSISQFGCAVRCATELPPGTRVTLECDGKKVPAVVTFVLQSSALEGFELGIAFEDDGNNFWGEKF